MDNYDHDLFIIFLIIRLPPTSTLTLHDALPIFHSKRTERCGLQLPRQPLACHLCSPNQLPRFPARTKRWQGSPACLDRKSTRLNSSHTVISYAVFCLKKKSKEKYNRT